MSGGIAALALAVGAAFGLGVALVVFGMRPRRAVDVAAGEPGSGDAPFGAAPRRSGGRLRGELELAGLGGVSVGALVLVSAVSGLLAAAVAFAVLRLPVLALVALVLGGAAPILVVRRRAEAQRRRQRAGWPDAVDHLVASVRSGLGLADSLAALAELGPASTRPAFAAFATDYRNTGEFLVALDRLETRLADPVADRILETLRMAREVGGTEVTEVLRGLAASLREDHALRAELVARQSWIRGAARLGVAAPWLLLLLLATRPETLAAFAGPGGTALLLVGVGVSVVAYRTMLALGRLPRERRWAG